LRDQQKQSAVIQPAPQLRAVLTGILPSKVAESKWQSAVGQTQGAKQKSGVSKDRSDGKKTLNHRGRRGAQRQTFFCHRVALISTDFKSKTRTNAAVRFFLTQGRAQVSQSNSRSRDTTPSAYQPQTVRIVQRFNTKHERVECQGLGVKFAG
jgi:hypothetical protein